MIIKLDQFILRPFQRRSALKFNNRCLEGDGKIHKIGENNGENYYLIYDNRNLYDKEGFICDVDSDDFKFLQKILFYK
jgi:hypothetical protein